jgi:hypothetical protein
MPKTLSAEQLDDLLAAGRTYASVVTVRAVQVAEDSEWTTERGDRLSARAGDWWVIDGDERWSVASDVFTTTYEAVGGEHFRKKATVKAVQLDRAFAVDTLEGLSTGEPGDWLVRNPTGECWPVPQGAFATRYRPTDAG